VAVFPVGSTVEQGWALRKDDWDLRGALQKFFEAQKASDDSLLNRQWKTAVGMTLPEYIKRVPK
jgi:hypothetical protein